ncbi:MAG: ankyrin repeat domain-containing protein [Gammaproteobacteria bacterium]|nr:ankyrin repeat domain-containing protein [Gammaproteobacteria bacterium]
MYEFQITPEFRNHATAARERLQIACTKQDVEISNVTNFITEEAQKIGRKADAVVLLLEFLGELLLEIKPDWVLTNKKYKKRFLDLYLAYIESYEDQLNNKERSYVLIDGQVTKLTPELRESYLQHFCTHQLPDEMKFFQNYIFTEVTDLKISISDLKKQLDYYVQQLEFLKNLRSNSAIPFMQIQENEGLELRAAHARFNKAVSESLYGSCLFGTADSVKALLKKSHFSKNISVDQVLDDEKNTAAHLIAQRGDAKIAQVLLDAGADLRIKNAYGYDAVHLALRLHNIDVLRLYLTSDKIDLAQTGDYTRTLLHTASFHGYLDVLQSLPEKIIPQLINAMTGGDNQESTALHTASELGFAHIVNWLLDHRANPSVLNQAQETPLMSAIVTSKSHIAELFFRRGIWLTETQAKYLLSSSQYKKQAGNIATIIQTVLQNSIANYQCNFSLNAVSPMPTASITSSSSSSSNKNSFFGSSSVAASSSSSVKAEVMINGLTFVPMPGDGSCLYHAVAVYLGKDQQTLRSELADRITATPDLYRAVIAASGKDFDSYVKGIRSGEWADHVEIVGLMNLLNRPIIIIDPEGNVRNKEDAQRSGEPIFVSYNGGDHYNSYTLQLNNDAREILNRLMQMDDEHVARSLVSLGNR